MPTKPEKFLTASAEEFRAAYIASEHNSMYEFVRVVVIPEVAREVREECAGEAAMWREDCRKATARAERAERERDAQERRGDTIAKDREEWWQTALRENREHAETKAALTDAEATIRTLTERLNDAEAARREAVADAERKGAWDALTKLAAEAWTHVMPFPNEESFDVMLLRRRDQHYAPAAPAGVRHDLKIWPQYFDAVASGDKTFEWRKDDRDYRVGDTLRLREWLPDRERYTGREITKRVSYILRGNGFPEGYAVLALAAPQEGR